MPSINDLATVQERNVHIRARNGSKRTHVQKKTCKDGEQDFNTLSALQDTFFYDPENGRAMLKKAPNAKRSPFKVNLSGYRYFCIFGRTFKEHRVIWMICNGVEIPHGYEIDHIDRNRSNNRIENLRLVTREQNQWNASKRKDNTSGFKGVSQNDHGTFAANISVKGKVKYLGSFKTAQEASEAYQKAVALYRPAPTPSAKER